MCIHSSRSGRRIQKTRKYDIITTPAERVEMAPLNEDNEDEDDSTLFDVKYRFVLSDCSIIDVSHKVTLSDIIIANLIPDYHLYIETVPQNCYMGIVM